MKRLIIAAVLALAACGENNSGGVMGEIERAEKQEADNAVSATEGSAAWLETVRAQAGVEARPSGLLIERRARGRNQALPQPTDNATVLVHYEGKLANGEVFDSSFERGEPAEFPLGAVVPGFSEAITLMRPGDEIVATFPMELGYGPDGRPPAIPPAAALQFRIILLAYREPGGEVVQAPQ